MRTKLAVTQAVRSFFGEVGAAMRIELIQHDEAKQEGVLRVAKRCDCALPLRTMPCRKPTLGIAPRSYLTRVWSALTVMTHFDEKQCTVDVLRVLSEPAELGLHSSALHDLVEGPQTTPAEATQEEFSGPVGSGFVSLS